MLARLLTTTMALSLLPMQAMAIPCPKEYLKPNYNDPNAVRAAIYWIYALPRASETDLKNVNIRATYSKVSSERPPDVTCSFKKRLGDSFETGQCTNTAGISWDPTPLGSTEDVYRFNEDGSAFLGYCYNETRDKFDCNIYIDNSGVKYDTYGTSFRRTILGQDSRSLVMVNDGTNNIPIDGISLDSLFDNGKTLYVAIGRQKESGIICTYNSGPTPNT